MPGQRGLIPPKVGIGLRFPHLKAVIDQHPAIAWLEVHTENYVGCGTSALYLDRIRCDYPISLHGVGLSLGTAEGLDLRHLERVRLVVERIEPGLVSEHLSWCIADGNDPADLLPLPMTEEALEVVCWHVDQTQAYLKRRILVENPSSDLRFSYSAIPEWEFLAAIADRTGCGILCDINNIFVSARSHDWNPNTYLASLPAEAIGEIHLAGHSVQCLEGGGTLRIDDHGSCVAPEVWTLCAAALEHFGSVPTLIEWDNNVPPLDILLNEAGRAAALLGPH